MRCQRAKRRLRRTRTAGEPTRLAKAAGFAMFVAAARQVERRRPIGRRGRNDRTPATPRRAIAGGLVQHLRHGEAQSWARAIIGSALKESNVSHQWRASLSVRLAGRFVKGDDRGQSIRWPLDAEAPSGFAFSFGASTKRPGLFERFRHGRKVGRQNGLGRPPRLRIIERHETEFQCGRIGLETEIALSRVNEARVGHDRM